jgi:Na+-translocating ferredoxin:NAD+ oxidoreductase RnfA subunit
MVAMSENFVEFDSVQPNPHLYTYIALYHPVVRRICIVKNIKMTNQKQELPMVAMFVNGSGQN